MIILCPTCQQPLPVDQVQSIQEMNEFLDLEDINTVCTPCLEQEWDAVDIKVMESVYNPEDHETDWEESEYEGLYSGRWVD